MSSLRMQEVYEYHCIVCPGVVEGSQAIAVARCTGCGQAYLKCHSCDGAMAVPPNASGHSILCVQCPECQQQNTYPYAAMQQSITSVEQHVSRPQLSDEEVNARTAPSAAAAMASPAIASSFEEKLPSASLMRNGMQSNHQESRQEVSQAGELVSNMHSGQFTPQGSLIGQHYPQGDAGVTPNMHGGLLTPQGSVINHHHLSPLRDGGMAPNIHGGLLTPQGSMIGQQQNNHHHLSPPRDGGMAPNIHGGLLTPQGSVINQQQNNYHLLSPSRDGGLAPNMHGSFMPPAGSLINNFPGLSSLLIPPMGSPFGSSPLPNGYHPLMTPLNLDGSPMSLTMEDSRTTSHSLTMHHNPHNHHQQ